jgi:S-adenosylmethionine:tRNA ribosyltransferase-isomerase
MNDPRKIAIKDYTYFLPDSRIAMHPLPDRDQSKLLVYQNGIIREDVYRNLADHFDKGSLIVFNNTRVIAARILFKKPSGAIVEIFCLEPAGVNNISEAFEQTGTAVWNCMVGGASKWKAGQVMQKTVKHGQNEILLIAAYESKTATGINIRFSWTPVNYNFGQILGLAGTTPLPPYIKRPAEQQDAERYQTIYSSKEGSVAAPTAGLHFSQYIFEELRSKNITREDLTLHVGAGTFKPVKSELIGDHEMHAEYIEVAKNTIENLLKFTKSDIIAVGTTTLRTLETLYWLGVKEKVRNPVQATVGESIDSSLLNLNQWEAYDLEKLKIPKEEALSALIRFMEEAKLEKLVAKTQILIVPGYKFKITDLLVTNFHQPDSTLLLLVAAFIGNDWKKVYQFALENGFRFLSYGDGCLLNRSD